MEKLVSALLESRLQAHIFHLRVNGEEGTYSAHVALEEYYSEIVGMVDGLVESYQGKSTFLMIYNEEYNITNDARLVTVLDYFQDLAKRVEQYSEVINEGFLKSQVEDIQALIYTTIYKLKRLQ